MDQDAIICEGETTYHQVHNSGEMGPLLVGSCSLQTILTGEETEPEIALWILVNG